MHVGACRFVIPCSLVVTSSSHNHEAVLIWLGLVRLLPFAYAGR